MADAEPANSGPRGAKFRKLAHVALMEDCGDSDDEGNAVVIGSRVSEKAISRSGLLSGIEHAAGLASLPAHLSPEDVKLWEIACTAEVEIPSDELVTVLKVADALGDTQDARWVEALATRAAAIDWAVHAGDNMLCSLLRLPPHILCRVLGTCLSQKSLTELITSFPAALHPDTLAAASGDDGELYLDTSGSTLKNASRAIRSALIALPHATIPNPGLLLLGIIRHPSAHLSRPNSTGAFLARAASAHPSLTSLILKYGPGSPQLLHGFNACLAPGAVPRLEHLHLETDGNADGCAEVAACLHRLPSLTSLVVKFVRESHDGKIPAEVSLFSYTRLATPSAALPHLRRLSLAENVDARADLCVRRRACANTLLPLVSAPGLTSLQLCVSPAFTAADAWTQVARYPSLRALRIVCDDLYSDQRDPFAAARAAADNAAPHVPHIVELDIVGSCMPSMHAMAGALASKLCDTLTSLAMWTDDKGFSDWTAASRAGKQVALEALPSLLTCCTGLRTLDFQVLCAVKNNQRRQFSDDLAAGLKAMPHLTSLILREAKDHGETTRAVQLCSAPLGEAISSLSHLAQLSVGGENVEFDEMQVLLDAFARLERLTSVGLCFPGLMDAHVGSILAGVPSLAKLTLREQKLDELESNRQQYDALFETYRHVQICSS